MGLLFNIFPMKQGLFCKISLVQAQILQQKKYGIFFSPRRHVGARSALLRLIFNLQQKNNPTADSPSPHFRKILPSYIVTACKHTVFCFAHYLPFADSIFRRDFEMSYFLLYIKCEQR